MNRMQEFEARLRALEAENVSLRAENTSFRQLLKELLQQGAELFATKRERYDELVKKQEEKEKEK